ncbi:MAG: CCA tRNA nucleotidyltransferase [Chloroflexi bacterium]|nr:CCA tRNA nucleotidyltransferase [Chloroflexota bacterium]
MSEKANLADKIEQSLPAELVGLIGKAAAIAVSKNQLLYLVGGIVRDLLLGQNNFDLDMVVEGDAIGLAKQFAGDVDGKLTLHPMFNTAKLTINKWSVDIAMARTETYARPSALPTVTPGTLETDLFRRDFTINAMAVCLNPEHYGDLSDLYGGLDDLKNKLIRVLHEKSFIDDATRIWRAIRYEQRLGFRIESETLGFLKRDVLMLRTVGDYRLRRELGLVLAEEEPEKVLVRADELGVLERLQPSIKVDDRLVAQFQEARRSGAPSQEIYLSIMTSRMTGQAFEEFVSYLRFSRQTVNKIKDMRVK